jgi:PAS domain-containing protein
MTSRTTKLDGLLEAVPDALVGVDRSGVIRLVNHQAELMFG